jgi:putative ABC transport system permease protein
MPLRNRPWLSAAGRLSRDSTLDLARAKTAVSVGRLSSLSNSQRRGAFLRLFRAGFDFREEPGQSLLVIALFLIVPFAVLAIGCVNVINLQLARAMDLAGELSLRLALGASRARIMQTLITEVVFLTGVAAIVGWIGAHWIVLRARSFFPGVLALDWTVFMFTLWLVTAVVGVAGVIPAWLTSRGVVAAGLRVLHDATPRRSRLRGLLAVVQVAASLALLALSGLALRALTLGSPKLPPDAEQILLVDIDLRRVRPAEPRSGAFVSGVLERLETEPSIHASAVSTFIGAGGAVSYWLSADGPDVVRVAHGGFVTSRWFSAMNVTVLAGHLPARGAAREFEAVINPALAAALGGGASVLGTPVRVQDISGRGQVSTEVVGVVADTETSADGKPVPMLFLPMPAAATPAFLLIARARDVPAARRAIADAVTEADPVVPLGRIESLDVRTSELFRGFRETAWVGLALGGLALRSRQPGYTRCSRTSSGVAHARSGSEWRLVRARPMSSG